MPQVLNSEQFINELHHGKGVVIVDFFATWCGPCKMLEPIFQEVKDEIGEKAKIVKVDIDKSLEIAKKFNISSVPTIIVFKDGKLMESLVGFTSKENLINRIKPYLLSGMTDDITTEKIGTLKNSSNNINKDTKLAKFTRLIEDINRNINIEVGDIFKTPLDLIFSKDRLNNYAKVILSEAYIYTDNWDLKYMVTSIPDTSTRIKAIQELMSVFRQEYQREEAVKFIFWALFITTVDKTDYEEKISLISDFSHMIGINESILRDITVAIKCLLSLDDEEYSFKNQEVALIFENVLSIDMVNLQILGKRI